MKSFSDRFLVSIILLGKNFEYLTDFLLEKILRGGEDSR